jgi:ankyrin repeat protein
LRYLIKTGDLEIFHLLYKKFDLQLSSIFRLSCQYGHLEFVKILLQDKRINPAVDENEYLRLACENGQYETVKLLLEDKRINASHPHNIPIMLAIAEYIINKTNIDILKYMLLNDYFHIQFKGFATDCRYERCIIKKLS